MQRIALVCFTSLLTLAAAPARATTIEQAMADPDWVAVRAMVPRKNHQNLMDELAELGAKLRFGSSLPARATEVAICTTGVFYGSSFEVAAHRPIAIAAGVDEAALDRLTDFDFPGNVRQLENVCHWLTVMAPAQVIEPKDLPPELLAVEPCSAAALSDSSVHQQAPMASGAPAAVAAPGASASLASGSSAPIAVPTLPAAGQPGMGLPAQTWLNDLQREARRLLESGDAEVWDTLTRQFEGQLIHTALEITRGRRIEAAQKLGIGRNTITRKIQELGLDD